MIPPTLSHPSILDTTTPFDDFAAKSLRGEALSRDEAHQVLCASDDELPALLDATLLVREKYFGRRVKLCVLLNAQSGICPEDCGYCSQSKVSQAPVAKYKLLPEAQIIENAKVAANSGARRFCIVIAARGPQQRDIDHLSSAVRAIKDSEATRHLEICTSLGLMNGEQCRQLKAAGVDYVNHNLNTGEQHYEKICSTHTYADRVQTLHHIQEAGLKTCSGGIVGLGESLDDIIDMGLALREMEIESIPVNFLLAIKGTRLESRPSVETSHALKVLCLMRLLNPDKEVRVSAGREGLGEQQALALYAANSLFVDGYLTTEGENHADVKAWIEAAGFVVEKSVDAAPMLSRFDDTGR